MIYLLCIAIVDKLLQSSLLYFTYLFLSPLRASWFFMVFFRHIGDSIQQVFERYNWTKAVLAYRPRDHMEWSGDLTCQHFMASGMF